MSKSPNNICIVWGLVVMLGGAKMLNLYDEYYNPDDDMDFTEDNDYDDAIGEKFAKDMFDFLTDIIKLSGVVSESFASDRNLNTHTFNND